MEEVVSSVSSHPEAPWVFPCTHGKYPITPDTPPHHQEMRSPGNQMVLLVHERPWPWTPGSADGPREGPLLPARPARRPWGGGACVPRLWVPVSTQQSHSWTQQIVTDHTLCAREFPGCGLPKENKPE